MVLGLLPRNQPGTACAAKPTLTGMVVLSGFALSVFSFQSLAPPDPATTVISGPNVPLPVQPISATIVN